MWTCCRVESCGTVPIPIPIPIPFSILSGSGLSCTGRDRDGFELYGTGLRFSGSRLIYSRPYNNIFVYNKIKQEIHIHVQAEEPYFHLSRVKNQATTRFHKYLFWFSLELLPISYKSIKNCRLISVIFVTAG